MKNGVIEYPNSHKIDWAMSAGRSGTGAAAPCASGRVARFGLGGLFGVAVADIAASGTGTFHTRGRFRVPKQSGGGTAIAAGARVGYDFANDRASAAAAVLATGVLGVVTTAAIDADTEVEVELNENRPLAIASVDFTITSTEAALNSTNGEYTFDTGFGAVPTAFTVVVKTSGTGVVKTGYIQDALSGGSAGQIRVRGVAAGTQLDAGDIVEIRAWR